LKENTKTSINREVSYVAQPKR